MWFPGSLIQSVCGFSFATAHYTPEESYNQMWLYQHEYRKTVKETILSSSTQPGVDIQTYNEYVVMIWMSAYIYI